MSYPLFVSILVVFLVVCKFSGVYDEEQKNVRPAIGSNPLNMEQIIEFEKLHSQNFAVELSLIDSFANNGIKVIMMLNGGIFR